MDVRIKKLNDLAKIPTRGSKFSAGYDLYAATNYDIQIPPHSTVKIGTGLAMDLPYGYFGAIFARSGLAVKQGLRLSNSVAVIDEDYRGEWIIALHNDSDYEQRIYDGDRIAQLVLLPYQTMNFQEVNSLSETDRGSGGFGSTGK